MIFNQHKYIWQQTPLYGIVLSKDIHSNWFFSWSSQFTIAFCSLLDAPICATRQPRVLGVAYNERLDLTCDVDSNPTDVNFHWAFNNKTRRAKNYGDNVRYGRPIEKHVYSGDEIGNGYLTSFLSNGTQSILTYTPGEVTRCCNV